MAKGTPTKILDIREKDGALQKLQEFKQLDDKTGDKKRYSQWVDVDVVKSKKK